MKHEHKYNTYFPKIEELKLCISYARMIQLKHLKCNTIWMEHFLSSYYHFETWIGEMHNEAQCAKRFSYQISVTNFPFVNRLVHFAKFREMQKMILRKIFREKWVRNFAKIVSAEFGSFQAQNEPKLCPFSRHFWCS